jgi:hypothetical protein
VTLVLKEILAQEPTATQAQRETPESALRVIQEPEPKVILGPRGIQEPKEIRVRLRLLKEIPV